MQNNKIIEVIIADDNIFLAEALAENLNQTADISVKKTFSTIEGLLNLLPENHVDILVLDVNFKGISSLDYITEIRKISPKLKIIALTSLNNPFIKQNALNKGVDYFKGKDSSYDKFDDFIRNCFNNSSKKNTHKTNTVKIEGVKFTNTKIKVLRALFEYADKTEDEIAKELNISTSSLKTHKKQLFNMTGTTKVLDLIKFGINNGILIS